MKFRDNAKIILIIWCVIVFIFVIGLISFGFDKESIFYSSTDILSRFVVFLFVTLAFLVSFISAIIYLVFAKHRKNKHLERSWSRSLEEGGVKSKQIHRMLEEYEKMLLENLYETTKDSKYDLDRRAPVFKVQGKLHKQERKADYYVEVPEKWYVKGVEINEDNYPPIKFKNFKKDDELVVEFSPHSKHVWELYRVFGRHRNWLLYLSPEIFDQVLSGKIKVIGRAPFGNHNLKEIKDGDIITFNHQKTGRKIDTKLEKITHYKTVEEMVQNEGEENILPSAKSKGELISFYFSLYNYAERIKKGGIYALRVSLINR